MFVTHWFRAAIALALSALVLVACSIGGGAYENRVPVSQPSQQASMMLAGWSYDPKPYASHRIVLKTGGYKNARMLSIHTDFLDKAQKPSKFRQAVRKALRLEGVRNVKFQSVQSMSGKILEAYRQARGYKDMNVRTWVITGESDAGKVKAAGVSLITAQGNDPGTSVEVFIAPVKEYERLGGYAVPATGILQTLRLAPDTRMLEYGRVSDQKAAEELEAHTRALFAQSLNIDAMKNILDMQTQRILLGLDQVVPHGFQDPIFDPNY